MNSEASQNNNQISSNQPVIETLDLNPTQQPVVSTVQTQPTASVTPVAPVQPVTPTVQTQPAASVTPVAPVQPVAPVTSVTPVAPTVPTQSVVPATPVQQSVPVVEQTPIVETTQFTTPVTPVVPIEPVVPAVEPVVSTPEVVSAQTSETPVQPVTPVQPAVPTAEQSNTSNEFSSLELNANDLLLNNVENKSNNNNQVIVPSENKPVVTEINTTTKKTNNAIIFILIVILALVSYFINDIANFYQEKLFPLFTNNDKNNDNNTSNNDNGFNLVDGYIKIGEPSSYINLKDIKFYNFRKNDSGKYISFNYLSSVKYSDIKEEEIYLELYDSNKEILYKELFNSESVIDKDSVSTYKININESEYNNVSYALVKIYSDSEKKSTSKLVCTYKVNNEFINLEYTNTYEFTNNALTKYSVNKGYEKLQDNAIILSTQEEIKKEYMNITKYNITSKYNDVSLEYSIDLSNYPKDFNPLYEKDTIITIVKNKEKLKGWECK